MLNKCPNALNVYIYDKVIHLVELCEIGVKTKRKSEKSANNTTATAIVF